MHNIRLRIVVAARRSRTPNYFLNQEDRLVSPSVEDLAVLAALRGVGVSLRVDWYVQELAVVITLTRKGRRLAVSVLDSLPGVKGRP